MPRTSDSQDFAASPQKPAIVVHEVVKEFKIKHNRSLKEGFVDFFKRKDRRDESESRFRALNGVSFEVAPGESLAVLGHNGSGKSTTLKLISGVQLPDSGWVRTRGRVAGLLEVGAGFHPDLTGRDNIYLNAAILGMSKEETNDRFQDIVDFSGLDTGFLDIEVKRYSSGMRSRLGFAVAVHTELDVLLVDEVLSVGDAAFRAKCNDKMMELREQGKTMFVVSHNINTVKKLCDRGIVLKKGEIVFDGSIEEAADYVAPPKKTKEYVKNTTEFTVAPEFQFIFEEPKHRLGQPRQNPVEVSENGGGIVQRFERGIATHSYQLQKTLHINAGRFMRNYLQNGGPAGEWGFIASRPYGSYDDAEGTRKLGLQHGVASCTFEGKVTFTPSQASSEAPDDDSDDDLDLMDD